MAKPGVVEFLARWDVGLNGQQGKLVACHIIRQYGVEHEMPDGKIKILGGPQIGPEPIDPGSQPLADLMTALQASALQVAAEAQLAFDALLLKTREMARKCDDQEKEIMKLRQQLATRKETSDA